MTRAKVRTVITAAGDSRGLFLPAGFGRPKSLTPWDGEAVLAHALGSYMGAVDNTVVAVNADEDGEWAVAEMVKTRFAGVQVVSVPSGVKGALATALMALGEVDECPLVVAAGDSMIAGGLSPHLQRFFDRDLDAATVAFPSRNPRWSYLAVSESGDVQQVAEKEVIGPYATTGVFYFRTARSFVEAATWCLVNNASHKGQFYVSATMNYLVSIGQKVGFEVIQREQYRSWSLPIDFVHQIG